MKLLYLSCHSILEYDELKIFEELGIDYFSLGSYIDPQYPVDSIRPPLTKKVDERLLSMPHDREALTKEFVDNFDIIVVMHVDKWITQNWEIFKDKVVVWRTIGQSTPELEKKMFEYRQKGMKIIRYSPAEAVIPEYAGSDGLIRFYKDPLEFRDYNGLEKTVITIAQNMQYRGEHCNYKAFTEIVNGFPAKLYGPKNESSGDLSGGFLSYDEMKQKYRDSRVYIYTGTQPACYTLNFIEAMMTGMPIVALGPKHATSLKIAGDSYEIPTIIQNGINGFWSDDINFLREVVVKLLDNQKVCKTIGQMGRKVAIDLFGKENIKEKWRKFLDVKN